MNRVTERESGMDDFDLVAENNEHPEYGPGRVRHHRYGCWRPGFVWHLVPARRQDAALPRCLSCEDQLHRRMGRPTTWVLR